MPSLEEKMKAKVVTVVVVGEGTSANLGVVFGPKASMLKNIAVVKKLMEGVIPPADKEKVEKLDMDSAILKFFHIVGQVVIQFYV